QQLRIHISVSPPYWQTWWFLLSLLLVGLVIVILAVNLKRQNSKLRIRNTDLQTAYNNTAALADLNEIGQKLVASLRLEENIGTIMEEIRDLRDLRSDVFAIDLLDEEGQMLESRLSIEDGKRLDSYAVSMDNVDSLGVACVKLALVGKGPNADGFIINDLADRGQYPFLKGEPGVQAGHPTRATLFVPMRVGTQVIGVITVQSYDPNVYSGYHLNMLQILGAYTAIAIDHSRASEARLRAERARTRAEQDDLIKSLDIKLLRSQLSPHFIFNSLGTIQYLVSEDDPRADDYTARLGEIMREVMMMITQSDVSLKTESDFLRRYVEAERIRFRNEYEFQWRMETAPSLTGLGVRIPPMLLQPFIENSLEHAFYPLPVGNHPEIRVYFGQKADQLVIVVQDNGVGLARHQNKKPATRPRKISTAMENIRRRADLINQLNQDKGCEMEIRSFDLSTVSPNKFTLVETWDLPLFEQGARFELHIPLSFKFSATTLND
ncbi:MAG TPA: GAF domain-containing protein, partial [Bacteroidetes bacterium]|nr:GAF domain-containing protein [Bacteroidota bacterium]